jgi:hypothetical protein
MVSNCKAELSLSFLVVRKTSQNVCCLRSHVLTEISSCCATSAMEEIATFNLLRQVIGQFNEKVNSKLLRRQTVFLED